MNVLKPIIGVAIVSYVYWQYHSVIHLKKNEVNYAQL